MSIMINQEYVKQYLDYNPNTGELTWIKKPSKKTVLGTRAGSLCSTSGYRRIRLNNKFYVEHRIIWLWVYGHFPKEHIDHINHVRDDNRLSNLREVTIAENARNRTKHQNTKVGEVGIWYCKRRKRYIAEIKLNQKKVYQRSFKNVEEAIQARRAKALELGFHENHGDTSPLKR